MKSSQNLQTVDPEDTLLPMDNEGTDRQPFSSLKRVEIWGGRLAMTSLTIAAVTIALKTLH